MRTKLTTKQQQLLDEVQTFLESKQTSLHDVYVLELAANMCDDFEECVPDEDKEGGIDDIFVLDWCDGIQIEPWEVQRVLEDSEQGADDSGE